MKWTPFLITILLAGLSACQPNMTAPDLSEIERVTTLASIQDSLEKDCQAQDSQEIPCGKIGSGNEVQQGSSSFTETNETPPESCDPETDEDCAFGGTISGTGNAP